MTHDDRILLNGATGFQLRIVRSTAETEGRLLEMEASYPPQSSPPPEHLHPKQEEEFLIHSGTMTARVGGMKREYHAGEVLRIPAGTPHAMWNPGNVQCDVTWRTIPALNTEQFFRDVFWLAAQGRTDAAGVPGPLDLAWLVPRYWDEVRVIHPQQILQRLALGVLLPFSVLRQRPPL